MDETAAIADVVFIALCRRAAFLQEALYEHGIEIQIASNNIA
ncbi:MAG: hypothetical protein U0559_02355 [Anaerolineae bacterium]